MSTLSYALLGYLVIGALLAGALYLIFFSASAKRRAAESASARSSLAEADHHARSVGGVGLTLAAGALFWPLVLLMAWRKR
jgi:hypothetical protein